MLYHKVRDWGFLSIISKIKTKKQKNMKKVFYSLLVVMLMASTAFAVATASYEVSYSIDGEYYIDVDFDGEIDTNDFLRIRVTSDSSGEIKEEYISVPSSGSIRTFVMPQFFEQLDGEGEYDLELAVCSSDIKDIVGGEYVYGDTDSYCEVFAQETVSYERVALAEVVLPSPPIADYEDGVMSSYEDYYIAFSDIDEADLDGVAALELYRRNVISGYPDGDFHGDEDVNRAEAAKFLMLARYGLYDLDVDEDPFPDVDKDEWYAPYIERCADEGIIEGYPDGDFKPADTVNTVEFLKMLTLTFDLDTDLSYSYSDVTDDSWFSTYAGIAEEYDLFPDRMDELDPADELTRYEVATAIYQYFSGRDDGLNDAAVVVRDIFSGVDAEICTNIDEESKLESCGAYAEEMDGLKEEFLEELLGEYSMDDFYDGMVPMTIYVEGEYTSFYADGVGEEGEVYDGIERKVILYLAIGDKREDFGGLDEGFWLDTIPFDVLEVDAISYSYDGEYYYGPGTLAYTWSGGGYYDGGYIGMQLFDYAQTEPYMDYTDTFHVLGVEYEKNTDTVINPMGLLHYHINAIYDFVDSNVLEDSGVLYYEDGYLQS